VEYRIGHRYSSAAVAMTRFRERLLHGCHFSNSSDRSGSEADLAKHYVHTRISLDSGLGDDGVAPCLRILVLPPSARSRSFTFLLLRLRSSVATLCKIALAGYEATQLAAALRCAQMIRAEPRWLVSQALSFFISGGLSPFPGHGVLNAFCKGARAASRCQ